MKIIIPLTILVSLTFFSCKDKITTPEERPPIVKTDYFPLAIGNSWTYRYEKRWGYGYFPYGHSDSSAGLIKWLIVDYNSGIYSVKEVKTDTIKDTTYTNYFNITQLDSIHILMDHSLAIPWTYKDTLTRYYYAPKPDTAIYYGSVPPVQILYTIRLKKFMGVINYNSSQTDMGDWSSENSDLISSFLNK